jgi:alkylation response protein AidB-like acyl-CoA dehydrogenase
MILSEEHQALRSLFREFAEREFTTELLTKLDETGEFNREIHEKMGKSGFTGVKIPEEYGGQGGDSLAYVLMMEEFARVSPVLSIYANTSNSLGGISPGKDDRIVSKRRAGDKALAAVKDIAGAVFYG